MTPEDQTPHAATADEPASVTPGPMPWMGKLRLKVYAMLAAVALAGFALVSMTAAPVLPVVFGAVAVVAVCVNTMTSKLRTEVCWSCGQSVKDLPIGTYGRVCPGCGAVTEPNTRLADAWDDTDTLA